MRMRFTPRKLAIVATAFLIGCLGNDSKGVVAKQYNGTWYGTYGTVDQGGDIFIRANGDSVSFVFLNFSGLSPVCTVPDMGVAKNILISNNGFSATLTGGGNSFAISGTFDSDTSASGTVTIQSSPCGISGALTWRASFQSSNASLSALEISRGSLSPAFASGTAAYSDTLMDTSAQVQIRPITAKKFAQVTVNGAAASSGSFTAVNLSPGLNNILVVVKPQDSSATQTYTITVVLVPYPSPSAPTLLSPGDTASNQSDTPTLSWSAVSGASSYNLQVSSPAPFATYDEGFETGNFTGQSWVRSGPLAANWIVTRDSRFEGAYAVKSDTISSNQTAGLQVIKTVPAGEISFYRKVSSEVGGDSLHFYIDGTRQASWSGEQPWAEVRFAVTTGSSHAFRWEYSKNATVNAGSDAAWIDAITFSSPALTINRPGLATTFNTLSGLTGGATYFWRVNASNSYRTGTWSPVRSFTTAPPPPPPIPLLQTPANGTSGQPLSSTLTWDAAANASSYGLQVAADTAFISLSFNFTGIVGASNPISYPINNLAIGLTYYWRVNATNLNGTSPWSPRWSFTTGTPPFSPVLSLPLKSDTGLSTSPTLGWNNTAGASSYSVQISTDSTFATAVNLVGITGTSTSVTGLSVSTRYYWHARAANSFGTGAWSPIWSFTTASLPPPPVPTLISPANAATGQATSPTLSWSSSAGATSFGLQVAADTGFTIPMVVNLSGLITNSRTVTGLTGGVQYYWRANATNANGTSAWSPVWSFATTPPPPPATPVLQSPTNGTSSQPLSSTLTWNTVANALTYGLQVATDTAFNSLLVNLTGIAGATNPINGLAIGMTYYWRVNATNTNGTSPWAPFWSFTTGTPPSSPVLSSPLNNDTGLTASPTLRWSATAGAASYGVQVSTDTTFATAVNLVGIIGTSTSVTGLSVSTRYYWHARATNSFGTGAWSPIWSFTTASLPPPPVPTLISPANAATGQTTSPTLSWSASVGATSFGLQVATDTGFTIPMVVNLTGLVAISRTVTGLSGGVRYYWRANAANANGTSAWSPRWSFTTVAGSGPAAPALSYPPNGDTAVFFTLQLSWNSSSGANSYGLQVSTDSAFSILTVNRIGIATLSLMVDLSAGTRYYWRVNAADSTTGAWSPAWSFTTATARLPTPVLISPANIATGQSTSPTLIWNAVSGADVYWVEVSTDALFSSVIYQNPNVTGGSSAVAVGLSGSTTYYWRVVAGSSVTIDYSLWSQVWSFTTSAIGSGDSYEVDNSYTAAHAITVNDTVQNHTLTSGDEDWLRFTAVSGTTYILQTWGNADPQIDLYGTNGTTFLDSNYRAPPAYNNAQLTWTAGASGTYYFRVKQAAASGGTTGAYTVGVSSVTLPSAPILLAPVTGATGISTSPTLDWDSVSGSPFYGIQVSTSPTFATTVVNDFGIASLSYYVVGLSPSTIYYWRVNAVNAVGTGAWSQVWSFTTAAPAIPSTPTLFSPSNSTTGTSTSPTLFWNSAAGATTYGLQVSTDSTFTLPPVFNTTGIAATNSFVPGLTYNTAYYWRVNATNISGTSAWSAFWKFTTLAPPPAPGLFSPANTATGQSTSLSLSWFTSSGATSYHLQVATDTSFAAPVVNVSGISATSYSVGGLSITTTYYWRVNATNAAGPGSWSAIWNFATGNPTVPATPILSTSSPLNGSIGITTSPYLYWYSATGATTYGVQVSTDSTFATTTVNAIGLTILYNYTPGLVPGATYYWRVNAANAVGNSPWSTIWRFTTAFPAPTLSSPASGSVGQVTSPTLFWNTVTGATSYGLQVATDSAFTALTVNLTAIATTSRALSGLVSGTRYYWRANAANTLGGTSPWSAIWSFTVGPPSAPILSSPSTGSIQQPVSPYLYWATTGGAASYTLQVSSDSNFSTTIFNQGGITTAYGYVTGLSVNTRYYWRVNAFNAVGTSAWSTVWSFTTITQPSTPILSSPSSGSIGQATALYLYWITVTGASSYTLQVSTDSGFSTTIFNSAGILNYYGYVTGLSASTRYFWRVNAFNAAGTSAWSTVWSFTTLGPPSAPTLSLPANGAVGLPASLFLSWNTATGAAYYRLQVATDSNFSSLSVNSGGLATTSSYAGNLSVSTTYYWRVSDSNAVGVSAWSQVWRFTTSATAPLPVLSQNFETDNGGFSNSGANLWQWGVPTNTYSGTIGAHSGTKVWGVGLTSNYPNYATYDLRSTSFTVPTSGTLSFWYWLQKESCCDYGYLEISTNGGATFTILANYGSGTPDVLTWTQAAINLSAYAGLTAIIRWRFTSDVSIVYPGWFIDDVLVQ